MADVLANGQAGSPNVACTRWHTWALHWINTHKPNLLVITQESLYEAPATASGEPELFTPGSWRSGLSALLQTLHVPRMKTVLLGDIPVLPESGPDCLADHPEDVQACSASIKSRSPGSQRNREGRGEGKWGRLCQHDSLVLLI